MIPDCQPKNFFAFVQCLGFPDKFPWFKGYWSMEKSPIHRFGWIASRAWEPPAVLIFMTRKIDFLESIPELKELIESDHGQIALYIWNTTFFS
jgi:hypothetical protein